MQNGFPAAFCAFRKPCAFGQKEIIGYLCQMKNSLLFCGLMLLLSLSACKVQEEIHFNKDLSGSLRYTLDLSAMRAMSAQMKNMRPDKDDTTGTAQPPNELGTLNALDTLQGSQLTMPFAGIQGLSNLKGSSQNGVIEISFNFKDLNALNQAYDMFGDQGKALTMGMTGGFKTGEMPTEEPQPKKEVYPYFATKSGYLVFSRPKKEQAKEGKTQGGDMGKQMGAMFEHRTVLTFDKTVRKVKAKNATPQQDEHQITLKSSLQELGNGAEIKIKLK
jgi:DNA-binding transcriptional regulator of glucitol operon